MATSELTFGDRVTVDTNNVLRRGAITHHGTYEEIPPSRWYPRGRSLDGWMRRSEWRHWRSEPKIREGIYIGWRTVSDGTTEYMGSEEGRQYNVYHAYRVAVVVLGEREKPVYVFPSDLTPTTREAEDDE